MQADQHDRGRLVREIQFGNASAQQFDQLVVDDLDDLLAGGDAFDHILADAFGFDRLDEFGDHVEVDVRIQQRQPDFPHRVGDIRLGQGALPPQLPENVVEFVAQ